MNEWINYFCQCVLPSVLCGVLYRLGGRGVPYNTKCRDFGVPIVLVSLLGYNFGWSYLLIPLFLLSFGSMTTYWKRGADCEFAHWLCTCFFYTLPFVIYFLITKQVTEHLLWCSILVPILGAVWSEFINKDTWEEFGRGFILAWFVSHIY